MVDWTFQSVRDYDHEAVLGFEKGALLRGKWLQIYEDIARYVTWSHVPKDLPHQELFTALLHNSSCRSIYIFTVVPSKLYSLIRQGRKWSIPIITDGSASIGVIFRST